LTTPARAGYRKSATHRDRLRDGPVEAGATFGANHSETVPTPTRITR
jgi:hypothetical protein